MNLNENETFGEFSETMSERFVPFSTLPISLKAIKEKNGLYNQEDFAFKSKSSGKMDILIYKKEFFQNTKQKSILCFTYFSTVFQAFLKGKLAFENHFLGF